MYFRLFAMKAVQRVLSYAIEAEDITDPWRPIGQNMEHNLLGDGSLHPFEWYMEGESNVSIGSLNQLKDWLIKCEYCLDQELFNERDFWQHPRTFETLRKGDCEDHAIWAWRKLIELGLKTRFVVGHMAKPEALYADWDQVESLSFHAWVIIDYESPVLFETTQKEGGRMLRPLDQVDMHYIPHFSVSEDLKTKAYAGMLLGAAERARLDP
ncbi:MAG: hypothetical protein ABL962_05960 [Fimbriimonadaceae bacterium]